MATCLAIATENEHHSPGAGRSPALVAALHPAPRRPEPLGPEAAPYATPGVADRCRHRDRRFVYCRSHHGLNCNQNKFNGAKRMFVDFKAKSLIFTTYGSENGEGRAKGNMICSALLFLGFTLTTPDSSGRVTSRQIISTKHCL